MLTASIKRYAPLLSVLSSGLLLLGCASGETPGAAPEPSAAPPPAAEDPQDDSSEAEQPAGGSGERNEIEMIVPANFGSAANYVALEYGYWSDRGLDVALSTLDTGSEISAAVRAGEAEFGGISLASSIPPASAAGIPVRGVALYMNDATFVNKVSRMALLAHPNSGVDPEDPATLRGKSIGLTEGSTSERYTLLYLEANGIGVDEVELVNLPVPDMPVSLQQQLTDVVAPWEPFTSQILLEQEDTIVVERGGTYGADILAISGLEETVVQRPEVVEALILGLFEATQDVRQDPAGAAEIASTYVPGIEPDVATSAIENHDYDPRVSVCTVEGVLQAANELIEFGTVEKDGEFVEEDIMLLDTVRELQEDPENQQYFEDLPPLPETVDDCN
ncbi:MAG: hypothetical protein GEU81_14365 [Nitriliruptorales bacterium]|nr:hypothetical protein [Nitriliruptorales bacterium]